MTLFRPERQQVGYDFGFGPELVRRYLPEPEHEGSIKMVRHINAVTTYLSWITTGEVRHFEGVIYGAAIAGMDCVTDYRHEDLAGGRTERALNGDPDYPELELLELASSVARGDGFDRAVQQVAEWQDESLKQFDDPSESDLMLITEMKGGMSAVAHLHAVKEDVTTNDEELMTEFGAVMQLLDDYLDQPDDERQDISTLFTEGYMTRQDLALRRDRLVDWMESRYGAGRATRRFRRVLKLHTRLGDLANRTPIDPERVVPWYL